VQFISDHDRTGGVVRCMKVSEIPSALKAGYWLYKSFKYLEQLPPFPVP
jgi:hypothetical protein